MQQSVLKKDIGVWVLFCVDTNSLVCESLPLDREFGARKLLFRTGVEDPIAFATAVQDHHHPNGNCVSRLGPRQLAFLGACVLVFGLVYNQTTRCKKYTTAHLDQGFQNLASKLQGGLSDLSRANT